MVTAMDPSAVLQVHDKYCCSTHLNLVWQRRVENITLYIMSAPQSFSSFCSLTYSLIFAMFSLENKAYELMVWTSISSSITNLEPCSNFRFFKYWYPEKFILKMYRGRSIQIAVIKAKSDVSEVGKYEGIEREERFRYASGMGKGSYGCCYSFRHWKRAIGLAAEKTDFENFVSKYCCVHRTKWRRYFASFLVALSIRKILFLSECLRYVSHWELLQPWSRGVVGRGVLLSGFALGPAFAARC